MITIDRGFFADGREYSVATEDSELFFVLEQKKIKFSGTEEECLLWVDNKKNAADCIAQRQIPKL